MAYSPSGPIDCSIIPDKSRCKGKSIVVTGGEDPSFFCPFRHKVTNRPTDYLATWTVGDSASLELCWVNGLLPQAQGLIGFV